MYQQILDDLLEALDGAKGLKQRITGHAQEVEQANNALTLEGSVASDFTARVTQAMGVHAAQSGASVHGEGIEDLGGLTATNIRAIADEVMDSIDLPITRIGSNDYLPPAISSGIQAVNNAFIGGAPMVIEPDGTLVVAVPATNGEVVNFYMHYIRNALSDIDAGLAVGEAVATNNTLTLANGWDVINVGNGNTDCFVLTAKSPANQRALFLVDTNGSFKDGIRKEYQITATEGRLSEYAAIPNFGELTAVNGEVFVSTHTVNGVRKVILVVEQITVAFPSRQPFQIYTADIPTSPSATTIAFTLQKNWSVTKSDGTTVNQAQNLLVTDKILQVTPGTDYTATANFLNSNVSLSYGYQESGYHLFPDPATPNQFVMVVSNWFLINNNVKNQISWQWLVETYRINFSTKTIVNLNQNSPIVYSIAANTEVDANSKRASGEYYDFHFYTKGASTLVRGNKYIVSSTGRNYNNFGIRAIQHPVGTSWYDWFTNHCNTNFPQVTFYRDIPMGPKTAITNNVRSIVPINDNFSLVSSSGYTSNGGYESDGRGGMPAVARHDDGIRPRTVNSIFNGQALAIPEAKSPRKRLTPAIFNPALLAPMISIRRLNVAPRLIGGAFYEHGLLSVPRTLNVNDTTADIVDHGTRTVLGASVFTSLRSQVASQLTSLVPGYTKFSVELFAPAVHNSDNVVNIPPLVIAIVVTATRAVRVIVFNATMVTGTSGGHVTVNSVTLQSVNYNQEHYGYSGINSGGLYNLPDSTSVNSGHCVMHQYQTGATTTWVLGWVSRMGVDLVTSTHAIRFSARIGSNETAWTFMENFTGYPSEISPTFYSDKQVGMCMIYGDSHHLSDYGSKIIGVPFFLNGVPTANWVRDGYYENSAFAAFTVKPPASFDLVLTENISVIANGVSKQVPAETLNIFNGITSPVYPGRIYIYIELDKEGDPFIKFSIAMMRENPYRSFFGYVDYTVDGIDVVRLFKVSKLGSFRITEGGSPDPALDILEIARTEGLPV